MPWLRQQSQPGALGPPIAGASNELIRHRVLHGTYPPGYVPKRGDSKQMPQFPHLAGSIDDLAAFLAKAGSWNDNLHDHPKNNGILWLLIPNSLI